MSIEESGLKIFLAGSVEAREGAASTVNGTSIVGTEAESSALEWFWMGGEGVGTFGDGTISFKLPTYSSGKSASSHGSSVETEAESSALEWLWMGGEGVGTFGGALGLVNPTSCGCLGPFAHLATITFLVVCLKRLRGFLRFDLCFFLGVVLGLLVSVGLVLFGLVLGLLVLVGWFWGCWFWGLWFLFFLDL